MFEHATLIDRIRLVQQREVPVTLDGTPAVITGYRNEFASVRQLGSGMGVEFAWATVAHILNTREGKFRS